MALEMIDTQVGTRRGTVSAYASGRSLDLVRDARRAAGRVTLFGPLGLKALVRLSKAQDLVDVDFDPATYLDRKKSQEGLFPIDWVAEQRLLRLKVVRSEGKFVPKAGTTELREAFDGRLGDGVVRIVSLHGSWLEPKNLPCLLERVRNCDDALGFAFASQFDPLDAVAAVDGLRTVLDAASPSARRVELLRTDLAGIGFVASGGALGSIGVGTSSRHHGLPFGARAQKAYDERKGIPRVFVPALLAWKQGTELGALSPFDGAGITICLCPQCDGRDLLRFDKVYKPSVPTEVREDARAHDMHTVFELARTVLSSPAPLATWLREVRRAEQVALGIASAYHVDLTVPPSVKAWK